MKLEFSEIFIIHHALLNTQFKIERILTAGEGSVLDMLTALSGLCVESEPDSAWLGIGGLELRSMLKILKNISYINI